MSILFIITTLLAFVKKKLGCHYNYACNQTAKVGYFFFFYFYCAPSENRMQLKYVKHFKDFFKNINHYWKKTSVKSH